MKHFFTFITSMLITFNLLAQPYEQDRRANYGQSKVTISSLTNRQVKILVDGNNYNYAGNDNELTISDMRPGYHSIKVYMQKNGKYPGRNNRGMQLIYDANVYVRPQYHIDIIINRFGKAFVDERQMNAAYYAEHDNDNNNWNQNNSGQAMSSRSFEQFQQTLRNESFDNTRLVVAKQTITANYFSAAQVKEIAQLFSFEGNKLELAKYAYRYTLDKNNYFILNDVFAYSSSREEMARYIQSYR